MQLGHADLTLTPMITTGVKCYVHVSVRKRETNCKNENYGHQSPQGGACYQQTNKMKGYSITYP